MLLVLAGDLDAGLVRLGARVDEVGVVAAAHQGVDLFRERRRRDVHLGVREVGELLHLVGGDVGELAAAVADVDAPEAGHGVEIGGAVGVVDGGAVCGGHDHLLGFQQLVLDDGVEDVFQVLAHDRGADFWVGGVGERHGGLLGWGSCDGGQTTAFLSGVTGGGGRRYFCGDSRALGERLVVQPAPQCDAGDRRGPRLGEELSEKQLSRPQRYQPHAAVGVVVH